jgi:trimethylamine---corrinoid protein Co-methyltransferase
MQVWNSAEVMSQTEVLAIHDQALRILAELGVRVEHPALLDLLADLGARVDRAAQVVRLPQPWMETFLLAASDDYDNDDSLSVGCTLPWGKRREYSGGIETTAGSYPQFYLDLEGQFRPHTQQTVADMTRLADALPTINRLGVMGVPSDVPALTGPLYMRLLAWKHAQNKLSGCGEVRDVRLIPYILEMGRIFADYKQEPLWQHTFAEVELLTPLRFGSVEAEIFVQFWQAGLKAGVGFMPIAGASTPITLAATVAQAVAESLFISVLYRACYGLKKLYLQTNSSILDMRAGMVPFGRPERTLIMLAVGQMARFYRAALWASAIHNDSKAVDIEAGYGASFNAIPAIMAGTIGLECYGMVSSGDANSALQLATDAEYLGGVKRLVRGFAVEEETLAWETVAERGIGGNFMDAPHTAAHFRSEHWQPSLLSRESLQGWLGGEEKLMVDRAREQVETIWAEHHPAGMDEATEAALRAVIQKAERELL